MKKKELGNLIDLAYRRAGNKATVIFADKLKDLGYEFATRAGISIGIKDMLIPPHEGEAPRGGDRRGAARSRTSTTRA